MMQVIGKSFQIVVLDISRLLVRGRRFSVQDDDDQ
jgi:hypothetical protein